MNNTVTGKYKNKILTLPNILSILRVCLIPIIVWLYVDVENYAMAGVIVIISGITDILDGIIARRFNMTSNLGKVLDPIADKATQIVVSLLLIVRFPMMIFPLLLGIIKETFMASSGYMIVKRRGIVLGACWHGKMATVTLTLTMILHLIWHNITAPISTVSITISSIFIFLSLILYIKRNLSYLTKKQRV
ncbi:MAG: CDP-alcohol phosphatidyltransferase family protein [Clostridia bacterium]|nr:CDP-alcohol phosphatidyltransferase family protein [Clostridia bacterium]